MLGVVGVAQAQGAYPNRVIRLVVPFAPGGTADIVARLLADPLREELGQTVVVENKPGAGGNIGGEIVARAAPDGYTLLLASAGPTVINPSLYPKMTFDPARDLAPVTMISRDFNLMVVNAGLPVTTVSEFIAYARTHNGQVTFGSPGNGTPAQLAGELLNQMAGLRMQHVPYKGTGPAVADLVAGHITVLIDNMPPLWPHVQSGKLRALAVATKTRASMLPDVPTMEEAGLPDFTIETWYGVLAPTGTPRDVITKLNTEMLKVIKSSEFAQRMRDSGAEPLGGTPADMALRISEETAKFAKIVKDGKVALE
jgi:tripartite-type tricarboxylate transporter receptor subunit TctC